MSDLRDIAILAPEEAQRIIREVMRLWDYSTPSAARALRVSSMTLLNVIALLELQEEFRTARFALRTRFADPRRK